LPIKAVAAFNGDELPVFSIRGFWMTGSFVSTGFEDESVFIAGAGFETVGWFIGRLEVVLTTRDDLSCANVGLAILTAKNTKHTASPTNLPNFINSIAPVRFMIGELRLLNGQTHTSADVREISKFPIVLVTD
jgi:hypothetical protein